MGDRKVILIADDEPELRQVLSMRLISAGYAVVEASNGKGAMNLACAKRPDLIILDIMMPQMDGMSLSQKLKDNPITKNIPIIFLTGLVDKQTESHDISSGQNIIFAKPYDASELLATIANLIGK